MNSSDINRAGYNLKPDHPLDGPYMDRFSRQNVASWFAMLGGVFVGLSWNNHRHGWHTWVDTAIAVALFTLSAFSRPSRAESVDPRPKKRENWWSL